MEYSQAITQDEQTVIRVTYNMTDRISELDLLILSTKCNYIAIGLLQLFLATGSPGNFIQVTNVVKDQGVLMDNSSLPSIHCKRKLPPKHAFIIMRSYAEISVSAFVPPPPL